MVFIFVGNWKCYPCFQQISCHKLKIMLSPDRVCRVGYALNPKKLRKSSFSKDTKISSDKWKGGGLADILVTSSDSNFVDAVLFLPWEWEVNLVDQPVFDVILHKLTEDIVDGSEKIGALSAYLAQNPSTVLIDPIESVRIVTSRSTTCERLRRIEQLHHEKNHSQNFSCPITQPNYFVFETSYSSADFMRLLSLNGMYFPVICKPVAACGTPDSHSMVIR